MATYTNTNPMPATKTITASVWLLVLGFGQRNAAADNSALAERCVR